MNPVGACRDVESLRRALGPGVSLHVRERVDSTNDEIRRIARDDGAATLLLVADEQSAGRGRLGRRWYSPPGSGLYLSLLRRPGPPFEALTRWTLGAGVALCTALERCGARGVELEWPNDLVVGARKLGGVLAESRSQGGVVGDVVLGVGINLLAAGPQAPPEIRARACSLSEAMRPGAAPDRSALVIEIGRALDATVARLERGEWERVAAAWLERSRDAPGRRVETVDDGRAGVTAGLAADGALLVRDDDGRTRAVRLAGGIRPRED